MRSVMHIVHAEMLLARPMNYWLEKFRESTGAYPNEVVLPAVQQDGPIFQSRVAPHPQQFQVILLPELIRQLKGRLDNVRVWCSINMSLGFLTHVASLRVLDHLGINLDHNMCIANTVVQARVKRLIEEIAGYDGVDGLVFDCTDLYPQSASNEVRGAVQNTCFCDDCLEGLKRYGFDEGKKPFLENDIQRVALRVDTDGVAHITIDLHPPEGEAEVPRLLLSQAIARQFVRKDDKDALGAANDYVRYLRARVQLTAESLKVFADFARSKGKRTAAILGTATLDLTTMVDVRTLSDTKAVDEAWAGSELERRVAEASEIPVLQYLFGRATYIPNNFFELFARAQETVQFRGAAFFRQTLAHIKRRMMAANNLNLIAVGIIEDTPWVAGYIGNPLLEDQIVETMVNTLFNRINLSQSATAESDEDDGDPAEKLELLLRMLKGSLGA
jgi:hypothetical protein